MHGGFVGVDIFFVISGYLITSVILSDCERGKFSFGRFYQRRIARLLVPFVAVAVTTLAAASFIYTSQDLASAGAALSAAALSIANFKSMSQGNYFVLSPDAQPFLHCWSLSVEEQFYLFFPALFLLLFWKIPKYRIQVLTTLFAVSFVACVGLTYARSPWAFYMLPARAWELLAGSIIAVIPAKSRKIDGTAFVLMPLAGLILTVLSLFVVRDGPSFPGFAAMLPVAGAFLLLFPNDASNSFAERALSLGPMVFIGRLSYSLYLWHWPVFSLVDYKYYSASPYFRILLKLSITGILTLVCFVFLEGPSRRFLNRPNQRKLAFACLAGSVLILAPLGMAVRDSNYLNADLSDVVKGGIHFNQDGKNGSLILMGDSIGSMYARATKGITKELGLKFNLISSAGEVPIPHSSGKQPPLWVASLDVIKRERPDIVLLVCNWNGAKNYTDGVAIAVNELRHLARFVIMVTRQPTLSKYASRNGIRNGNHPTFIEIPAEHALRTEGNAFIKTLQADNVRVVDIESLFLTDAGKVRFTNDRGQLLYQDFRHLTDTGVEFVKPALRAAIAADMEAARIQPH